MKQKMNDKTNGKKDKSPLSFSCEQMLKYLPDFCVGKLRSEVVLAKIRKHLKENISDEKCACSDRLVELQKEKERNNDLI